jgi:MSHA biogenesis protein MshJ
MKALWKKFADSIDQRTTRERALILATSCVVVLVLMDSLLIGPVGAERKRLVQDTQSDQAEATRMAVQLQALRLGQAADPDAALRSRLAELADRQAQLQRQIDAQSAELVPPEKMPAVLEKILANNPRLQMIEVKTLPRTSISLEKEAAPGQAQPAKPADEKKLAEIYRYGVEVTMRGSYLDLLAYLKELESLPVRMFWDKVHIAVTAYPTVTMRLVVYTISLDKTWLTV